MNMYDSARMADALVPFGYVQTDTAKEADIIVLNTCHIREKASEKVYSELGRLKKLQEDRQQACDGRILIAVGGCVAQAEGEEILNRAPHVDIVFGPQTLHRLPTLVEEVLAGNGVRAIDIEFPAEDKFDHLPEEVSPQGVSSFLSIQEGCDRFCTFCVVPYTRGAEQSRPVAAVLAEANRLVSAGSREIILLGQNVNSYHGFDLDGREVGLGRLINMLAEIQGLSRIRYTTSHPRDVDDELIEAHRNIPQLMPHLHLPVQSGSDRILAAMNRRHTADEYRHLIDRLRAAQPNLALSSDFIVGFPGETDRDFGETLRLIDDVGYAQAFSFKYSARAGTPAASRADQVSEGMRSDRLESLQQLLRSQQESFNLQQLGNTLPVLVEGAGRANGQLVGRTPFMQTVHFQSPRHQIGSITYVRINKVKANSLGGSVDLATKLDARKSKNRANQ